MISIASLLPKVAGQESKGKIIVKYDASSDFKSTSSIENNFLFIIYYFFFFTFIFQSKN